MKFICHATVDNVEQADLADTIKKLKEIFGEKAMLYFEVKE